MQDKRRDVRQPYMPCNNCFRHLKLKQQSLWMPRTPSTLNCQNALRDIQHLCPSLLLINTYQKYVQLHIDGEMLLSQEGTTQGDPTHPPSERRISEASLVCRRCHNRGPAHPPASMMGPPGGDWPWLRLPSQCGEDMGSQGRQVWCHSCRLSRHQSEHHNRRQETARSIRRHKILCQRVCSAKSCSLGLGDWISINHCHHPTPGGICCIHPWSHEQMDVPGRDHSRHRRPFPAFGGGI